MTGDPESGNLRYCGLRIRIESRLATGGAAARPGFRAKTNFRMWLKPLGISSAVCWKAMARPLPRSLASSCARRRLRRYFDCSVSPCWPARASAMNRRFQPHEPSSSPAGARQKQWLRPPGEQRVQGTQYPRIRALRREDFALPCRHLDFAAGEVRWRPARTAEGGKALPNPRAGAAEGVQRHRRCWRGYFLSRSASDLGRALSIRRSTRPRCRM